MDTATLQSGLPDKQRQLAQALREHAPSELARILGVARSTLLGRAARLRPLFARGNLRDYL